jgi:dTDP-4-dehydrorhamnose 3,5-epimerase
MKFHATTIDGAWRIEPSPHRDERGSFARLWCARDFAEHGIETLPVQANVARNSLRGTLRGMHWQAAPHEEGKLVRCSRGAVYLVVLDLRESSPSHLRFEAFELTGESACQVWAPEGCALGYQTLEDDTEITYLMSSAYAPAAACGARYDDPAFGISWPLEVTAISNADRNWPAFVPHRKRANLRTT